MATITGTGGNDTLTGFATNEPDLIFGRSGNDRLTGGSGGDTVVGGKGHDSLNGGVDCDTVRGGVGDDLLGDTNGPNKLAGGRGDDVFIAVSNAPTEGLAPSVDSICGGAGLDTFRLASNVLNTSALADVLLRFDTGVGGDVIDFGSVFFTGAAAGTELFGAGYLRLVETTRGTLLQADRDGTGTDAGFQTILLLRGTDGSELAAANFASSQGYQFDPLV